MKNLILPALLLALHLPAPAASLTCAIHPNQVGKPICWCRTTYPPSRWTTYPMVFCRIVR